MSRHRPVAERKEHFIKSRILVAVAALLAVFSIPAAAQEYPKLEVPIGFSFVNVYPDITPITSFNIFGGGGGFVYKFSPVIGIKAVVLQPSNADRLLHAAPTYAQAANSKRLSMN